MQSIFFGQVLWLFGGPMFLEYLFQAFKLAIQLTSQEACFSSWAVQTVLVQSTLHHPINQLFSATPPLEWKPLGLLFSPFVKNGGGAFLFLFLFRVCIFLNERGDSIQERIRTHCGKTASQGIVGGTRQIAHRASGFGLQDQFHLG